jgi:hypothetical protein
MSTPNPSALPPWANEIIDLYESGARAQFILHGNVDDRPAAARPRQGAHRRARNLSPRAAVGALRRGDPLRPRQRHPRGKRRRSFRRVAARREGERPAEGPARGHHRAHPLPALLRQRGPAQTRTATRVAVIVRNAGLIVPPSRRWRELRTQRHRQPAPRLGRGSRHRGTTLRHLPDLPKTSTTSIRSSPATRRPPASPFPCRSKPNCCPPSHQPRSIRSL